MTVKTTISNRTIFKVLAITLLFVLGVYFVMATKQALIIILVALFLALALNPPVNALAQRMPRGSRGLATAAAYLVTLFVLGVLLYALVPPLIGQAQQLVANVPEYIEGLDERDDFMAGLVQRFDLVDVLRESHQEVIRYVTEARGPIFNVLTTVSTSIVMALTVVVLAFFMLIEGPTWLKKFWELQPKAKRKHRQELAHKLYRVVTSYVNGQLLIAFTAFTATLIMLLILGVPFAVPLAAIVGIFGLIPLIGTIIGSFLVIVVGLFQSLTTGLILLIFFIVYNQIENNVFQPIVQARSVQLSPLLILLAAILGLALAGILGAFLAIPVAACLRVLLIDYLERREKGLLHRA